MVSLSIKCVQPVQAVWIKMCTSLVCTHTCIKKLVRWCTTAAYTPLSQQVMNTLFMPSFICVEPGLYTLSTTPTITTIDTLSKRQEQTK